MSLRNFEFFFCFTFRPAIMNRAGDGTPPATKSGRKVKRPAHFDDSPNSKEVASPGKRKDAAPEAASAKKSARKTLVLAAAGTPPSAKNGSDSDSSVKKSARKTKNGREESPEPEVVKKVAPESARKTLLKSAVKNSSADGAGTPKKTPAKKVEPEPEQEPEAGPGLSRTGRKIKVPAHLKEFEDVVVPVATSRKSMAPSVKKEEPEVVTKAQKKPVVRQLATEHEAEVEEKVVAKTPGRGKSLARKPTEEEQEDEAKPVAKTPGRARSVARKTVEEEEVEKPVAKTPGRAKSLARKLVEEEEEEEKPAVKTPGRSRSVARKASVDEATFEEKPAPRTYGRARSMARQTEEEDKPAPRTPGKFVRKPDVEEEVAKPAPKTPARTKSVPRKFADEEDEPKPAPKTPSRAKSMAARKPSVDEPAPVPPKTPSRRARSIAPQATKPDEEDPLALAEEPAKRESPVKKQEKPPAKTPSKRAKSPEPVEPAPMSRSGRKIKPKKYFGEFEQDETVPTVVAAVPKVASPVKSPRVVVAVSPTRPRQQQIVKKGSPYAPKKDQASPAKRLAVPEQKDTNKDEEGSPFKISPATEDRQITKRNVNDHHHKGKPDSSPSVSPPKKAKLDSPVLAASTSEPEIVPERDPLESVTPPKPAEATEVEEEAEKPKRGRKTLPVVPTPKTPARRTIAAVAATVEEPGSSRSGRKIKPKKFFDDGEEQDKASVTVAPAAAAAGRGKRKTIAVVVAEPKEDEVETKKEEGEEKEVVLEPVVSREEIMAIVGGQQEPTPMEEEADKPAEEPANGTLDKPDGPSSTEDDTSAESEQSAATVSAAVPEKKEEDTEEVSAHGQGDVSESAGNFPETQIEQTPPLAVPPTAHDDPVPSAEAEAEPQTEAAEASASSHFSEALLVEEESVEPTVEEKMEELFESVEFLEDSAVAGRLSEMAAAAAPVSEEVPAELLEQDLGGVMAGEPEQPLEKAEEVLDRVEAQPEVEEKQPEPVEEPVQATEPEPIEEPVPEQKPEPIEEPLQEPVSESIEETVEAPVSEPIEEPTLEQEPEPESFAEDDLDKTEAPSMPDEPSLDSVTPEEDDLERTQPPATMDDTAEDLLATGSVDEFFAESERGDESILVLPETHKEEPALDLIDKCPEPQTSTNTTAVIIIPETPKTPESRPVIDKFSPDKPDTQELATIPEREIIEIFDSPVPAAVVKAVEPAAKQSATSTPLAAKSSVVIQNARKRSLSASDADLSTKKNVTFHSPANSTILVDTLDERLKKSTLAVASSKSLIARKRSFSEHKELLASTSAGTTSDGPKPAKISCSKLPNFRTIHQNQFNRMESIADYQNRKVQRAKDILTSSATKSPAAARNATPQKSAVGSKNGGASSAVTQLKFSSVKPTAAGATTATTSKPMSDVARQEKRQQQFKAAFKSKSDAGKPDSPEGSSRRVVEQSRHKQHQILKGVRTNKRFELLMKFRDAAQD